MAVITIAGCDPAFRNTGLCKGQLDMDTGDFTLSEVLLISPDAVKDSKQVRVNSIDLKKARQISEGLLPFLEGVDLLCIELPVGTQSASGMKAYGVCIGLFATITIPMIQVTAYEVKTALTGNKNATKNQMIQAAMSQYPDAQWLRHKSKGVLVPTSSNEHIADSVGAIHAGVLTDQFKAVQHIYKGK